MTERIWYLVISGGRRYVVGAEECMYLDALVDLHRRHGWTIHLVVGDCPTGVDSLVTRWAEVSKIPTHRFVADWQAFGKAAGPRRNLAMCYFVEGKPCALLAFPGGRGTASMIRVAEMYHIPRLHPHLWRPHGQNEPR